MPIKPLGAILIILGGFLAGHTASAAERRRAEVLHALIASLSRVRAEIALLATQIPDIFEREAQRAQGSVRAFYEDALRRYLSEPRPLRESWTEALAVLRLTPNAQRIMSTIGASLGVYDALEQASALDAGVAELRLCADRADADGARRGELLTRVCPMVAAAMAILLW